VESADAIPRGEEAGAITVLKPYGRRPGPTNPPEPGPNTFYRKKPT